MIKRFFKYFLSIYSSIFFLFVFAVCMAVATFIENDFGTIEAKILVFNAFWFELLLAILTVIFVYNIFKYKLYIRNKMPILFLHLSFIFILFGAGITRYISQEGTMPISEGESENSFISSEAYLEFDFHDTKTQWKLFPRKLFLSQLKGNDFKISTEDFQGRPITLTYYDFVADYLLKQGDLIFKSNFPILKANMQDPNSQKNLDSNKPHSFEKMTPYFLNNNAFLLRDIQNQDGKVFLEIMTSNREVSYLYDGDYLEKGGISFSFNNSTIADVNITNSFSSKIFIKNEQEIPDLLQVKLNYLDYDTIINLEGGIGIIGEPVYFNLDSLFLKISYGSREIKLPFSIKLNDFQMERYPGSDSPSSYASEISVIPAIKNSNEKTFDYRIYMNNILNYNGYRFFQASYFPDESGTILSVNQDRAGTLVTYLGYFMLLLSVISVLISKSTRFGTLSRRLDRKKASSFLIFFFFSTQLFSYNQDSILHQLNKINLENSNLFSKVLVEDNDGRIKPFQTLSSDVLRKISRKQSLSYNHENKSFEINANQILLGMILYPEDWKQINLITIGKNEKVKNIFPINKNLLSYWDFWKPGLKVNFPPTSFNTLDTTLFSSDEPVVLNNFNFSFNKNLDDHINLTLESGYMKINSPDTIKYMLLNGENEGEKGVILPYQVFTFQEKIVFTVVKGNNQIIFVPTLDLNAFNYRLKDYVEIAYSKKAGQRNKFDNAIMELDERFNICYTIFNSIYRPIDSSSKVHLNFFPKELPTLPIDEKLKKVILNEKWTFNKINKEGKKYFSLIKEYVESSDSLKFNTLVKNIIDYQRENADDIIPSKRKINLEIFYNKVNPFHFSRLLFFYLLLGFSLLVVLIIQIFFEKNHVIKNLIKFLKFFIFSGFLFHTIFLVFRGVISGHAPWSDAYESLIFISWATLLSGLIFTKKSNFSLAGASIVGSILLLVANLNWINPEITNLVPVLNSYWLMIHVSIITSSYGFLGLSAFLGVLTLFLIIFTHKGNFLKINTEIKRLVGINEICMVLGLFLLTIGTFLGGVWANESWGRYWGWDPKETWALISVVVYSIILHIRLVSTHRFKYLFSVASVIGFSSIIMTYFGVNFYLSGLHSYANGEPPPAQSWIYISSIITLIIIVLSGLKFHFSYLNQNFSSNKKTFLTNK